MINNDDEQQLLQKPTNRHVMRYCLKHITTRIKWQLLIPILLEFLLISRQHDMHGDVLQMQIPLWSHPGEDSTPITQHAYTHPATLCARLTLPIGTPCAIVVDLQGSRSVVHGLPSHTSSCGNAGLRSPAPRLGAAPRGGCSRDPSVPFHRGTTIDASLPASSALLCRQSVHGTLDRAAG